MTRKCDECGKKSRKDIPFHYFSHYSDYKCRSCYRSAWKVRKSVGGGLSQCSECGREEAPLLHTKPVLIPHRARSSLSYSRSIVRAGVCNQCGGKRNLCNEELGKDPHKEGWLTDNNRKSSGKLTRKLDCKHCKRREKLFERIDREVRKKEGKWVEGQRRWGPSTNWTHRYWQGVEMFESKAYPGFVYCHYCSATDRAELKRREMDDAKKRAAETRKERAEEKRKEEAREAALAVRKEEEAQHRYFDARFGRKKTSLKDWEKTYKKASEIGGKSTRAERASGLEKSGVHPTLVEAYVDGMLDKPGIIKLRKIEPPDDEELYREILKIAFSYEHHRAEVASSSSSLRIPFYPKQIHQTGWMKLNIKWTQGQRFFSPVCMELISPGVAEEQAPAKRLARHIEGLIRMNEQVEGILNRAVLLPEQEFEVIITILGKEMGDEEQRLLRMFVEGVFDGSDVYDYIEEYGLGDPDLIGFLGRILNGEDVELVLDDAGLLNT